MPSCTWNLTLAGPGSATAAHTAEGGRSEGKSITLQAICRIRRIVSTVSDRVFACPNISVRPSPAGSDCPALRVAAPGKAVIGQFLRQAGLRTGRRPRFDIHRHHTAVCVSEAREGQVRSSGSARRAQADREDQVEVEELEDAADDEALRASPALRSVEGAGEHRRSLVAHGVEDVRRRASASPRDKLEGAVRTSASE